MTDWSVSMKTSTLAKSDRKDQIYRATRELLARGDFHSLTIDDVARRAGIAKGTVYLYFKTKESLYADLVQSLFGEWFEQVESIVAENAPPEKSLRRIVGAQLV